MDLCYFPSIASTSYTEPSDDRGVAAIVDILGNTQNMAKFYLWAKNLYKNPLFVHKDLANHWTD